MSIFWDFTILSQKWLWQISLSGGLWDRSDSKHKEVQNRPIIFPFFRIQNLGFGERIISFHWELQKKKKKKACSIKVSVMIMQSPKLNTNKLLIQQGPQDIMTPSTALAHESSYLYEAWQYNNSWSHIRFQIPFLPSISL